MARSANAEALDQLNRDMQETAKRSDFADIRAMAAEIQPLASRLSDLMRQYEKHPLM